MCSKERRVSGDSGKKEEHKWAHLAKVQQAVLEVVAQQCGALVDGNIIADVDQVKVRHVHAVNVHIPPDARPLDPTMLT